MCVCDTLKLNYRLVWIDEKHGSLQKSLPFNYSHMICVLLEVIVGARPPMGGWLAGRPDRRLALQLVPRGTIRLAMNELKKRRPLASWWHRPTAPHMKSRKSI